MPTSVKVAGGAFLDDILSLLVLVTIFDHAGVPRPDVGHVFNSPVPKSFGDRR